MDDLRRGRHSVLHDAEPTETDFWIQSIWRAQVLPAFDADASIAVVTSASPWQSVADPLPAPAWRFTRRLGFRPAPPQINWRKAVLSLQGEPFVVDLPHDPVAHALRQVDLFETFEHATLDGIGYRFEIETWNVHATFEFGNPEVPSLHRLAKSLLAVGWTIVQACGDARVSDYLKAWSKYER